MCRKDMPWRFDIDTQKEINLENLEMLNIGCFWENKVDPLKDAMLKNTKSFKTI